MRTKMIPLLLLIAILFTPAQTALAAPRTDVTDDQVTFDFPEHCDLLGHHQRGFRHRLDCAGIWQRPADLREVVAKAYPISRPEKLSSRMDLGHASERLAPAWGKHLVALDLHRRVGEGIFHRHPNRGMAR